MKNTSKLQIIKSSIPNSKPKSPLPYKSKAQCSVKTHVLSSDLPRKDLVIGFNVYFKSKFRILPHSIQCKAHFILYTIILSLYEIKPSIT
jgi:hypothetical protein